MSWPQVKLSDICRPKQWKTIASSQLLDEGFPVYGANGQIGYYSEYTHEAPTLMITCRGATCGNIHISELMSYMPMSYINGNAMALDNLDQNRVDMRYLAYFFKKRGFADVISGSAQPQITRQGLDKVFVPLPHSPNKNASPPFSTRQTNCARSASRPSTWLMSFCGVCFWRCLVICLLTHITMTKGL